MSEFLGHDLIYNILDSAWSRTILTAEEFVTRCKKELDMWLLVMRELEEDDYDQ